MTVTTATARPASPSSGPGPGRSGGPLAVVLGALVASRIVYWYAGLRFDVGFIDGSMQVADYDLLRSAPLSTTWYLHLQPPLFNLFVGLGANLFGSWAGLGFQLVYLAVTVAMLVAFVHFCLDLGVHRVVTTVLGTFLAVSPTIAQYEHLLFYTHLELALLVFAARGLQRACVDRSTRGLVVFGASLCALALGRSLYHPVWFAGLAVLLAVTASGRVQRRHLVAVVLLPLACGLAVGAKNQAVFGWWTTSSLEGLNLHRITAPYLTVEERRSLVADGSITSVSTEAFSCGDARRSFPPAGPDRSIPVLDRRWRAEIVGQPNLNERHNVRCFEQLRGESLRVLLDAPDAYLRGVRKAFPVAFSSAVPDVRVREGNQDALAGPGRVEGWALGALEPGPNPFDHRFGDFHARSTLWLLALVALAVPIFLARELWVRRRDPAAADAPVLAFVLFVSLTGSVLVQLTEVGENNRLIVPSWPMLLAGAGLAVTRLIHRRPGGGVPDVTPATR